MVEPKSRNIGRGVFTLLLVALLVLGGCDLEEESDGGGTTPSVDSVDNVTLTETAATGDFGTLSGTGYVVPADKGEAFMLMGFGLEEVGTYLEPLMESWEPSGTSFSLTPEGLMDGTLQDPPSQIVLEAALADEVIGLLGADAGADADVNISYNSDDLPTRITASATGNLHANLTGEVDSDDTDQNWVPGGSMHAVLQVNLDVAINDWRTVTDEWGDEEQIPTSIDAAYAVSLQASSAMSVEANLADDLDPDNLVHANLLANGGFSAQQTLEITQAMLDDEEQLMTYLEDVLEEPDFNLEIKVYDGSTLADTYTYAVTDFQEMM